MRRRAVRAALVLLPLWLGVSCAHVAIDPELPEALRAGELDPTHVVFIGHGMLKDLGADWDQELARMLAERGVLAIPVTYWSDPSGVWLDWGWRAPAAEIVRLAEALRAAHERLCPHRPLILDAVGFSNGCEVMLGAAARTRGARFRRLLLMHSSSLAFSFEADRLAACDRFDHLLHYWSPIDGTTLLAPFGAGALSLWNASDRVENRFHWLPHIAHLLGESTLRTICDELLQGTREPAPIADAFAHEVAELLESARRP